MKLNLGVIYGGPSTEHEISIISAVQAMNSIDKEKYEVIPIYLSKNNDFYYSNGGWESTQRTRDAYKKAIEERENAS